MANIADIAFGGVKMPLHRGVAFGVEELREDWSVAVNVGNTVYSINVRAGFEFDGASIPRFLWRVCGHPMEIPRLAAALAHDWLYASHKTSRETADMIYRAICRKMGISALRAAVEYRALRMFGGGAWKGHIADEAFARTHGALFVNGSLIEGDFEPE